MEIMLEKERMEKETQAKTLDEELPFISAEMRSLLIKEIKEIKDKLLIIEMKQKRIEAKICGAI